MKTETAEVHFAWDPNQSCSLETPCASPLIYRALPRKSSNFERKANLENACKCISENLFLLILVG
jgi:hypothetical protein